MNLVIDDAVEVQQAPKNQQRRRQLGLLPMYEARDNADHPQGKYCSRGTTSP